MGWFSKAAGLGFGTDRGIDGNEFRDLRGDRRRGGALEHFQFDAGFLEAAQAGEGIGEIALGGVLTAEELAEDVGAGGIVIAR